MKDINVKYKVNDSDNHGLFSSRFKKAEILKKIYEIDCIAKKENIFQV
jgi:hypothetical protein